jgi:hypothetical protein
MSDPVRGLVQGDQHHPFSLPVPQQRCDECRDVVAFTDLRDLGGFGFWCANCVSDFEYWRQRMGLGPVA